jgi:hypothetical protein
MTTEKTELWRECKIINQSIADEPCLRRADGGILCNTFFAFYDIQYPILFCIAFFRENAPPRILNQMTYE